MADSLEERAGEWVQENVLQRLGPVIGGAHADVAFAAFAAGYRQAIEAAAADLESEARHLAEVRRGIPHHGADESALRQAAHRIRALVAPPE